MQVVYSPVHLAHDITVETYMGVPVPANEVAERAERIRTALEAASDAGVCRVVLEVAHENARAWAFYSRMGFRPTGETGSMPWDPSVTEERMVLDLPAGS